MTNKEKYDEIFVECFNVGRVMLNAEFVYQCVPEWDSVGHMGMIAAIEETFDIMMEMDDIIDFGSYTIGVELLAKYEIQI